MVGFLTYDPEHGCPGSSCTTLGQKIWRRDIGALPFLSQIVGQIRDGGRLEVEHKCPGVQAQLQLRVLGHLGKEGPLLADVSVVYIEEVLGVVCDRHHAPPHRKEETWGRTGPVRKCSWRQRDLHGCTRMCHRTRSMSSKFTLIQSIA
jgi:hypothetical protein